MFLKKKKNYDSEESFKLKYQDKNQNKKKKQHKLNNAKKFKLLMSLIKRHNIVFSLLLVIILSLITYHSYNSAILATTNLVDIPVTNKYLKSNHKIMNDDITMIKIPKYIILENVETNVNNIVGKYVNTFDSLSKGSLIYKDIIISKDKINNAYLLDLKKDEVAISIDSDVKSSYSNSILENQLIDLYYLGEAESEQFDNEKQLVYGEIVKNARVIAVKDKDGANIDGDNENSTAIVVVALNQEDAHVVELAKASGRVSLVISYDNINYDNTNNYYNLKKMTSIILGKSIDVKLVNNE